MLLDACKDARDELQIGLGGNLSMQCVSLFSRKQRRLTIAFDNINVLGTECNSQNSMTLQEIYMRYSH